MQRETKIKRLLNWRKRSDKEHLKHFSLHYPNDVELQKKYNRGELKIPRREVRIPFPKNTSPDVLAMVDKLYGLYMAAAEDQHQPDKFLTVVWLLAFEAWFPDEVAKIFHPEDSGLLACQRAEQDGWRLWSNDSEMYAILFDLPALDSVRVVWERI